MDNSGLPASDKAAKSPWRVVAIGCGIVVVLVVVGGLVVLWQGLRLVGNQLSDMTDPVKRAAQVKRVMGADALPPGYFATTAIAVETPITFKMAILSDIDPQQGDAATATQHRGLTWFELRKEDSSAQDLNDFLEGRSSKVDVFQRWDINLATAHPLQRGNFQSSALTVHYLTYQGTVKVQGQEDTGINTVFSVGCSQDGKDVVRFGVWFSRHPDDLANLPATEVAPAEGAAPVPNAPTPGAAVAATTPVKAAAPAATPAASPASAPASSPASPASAATGGTPAPAPSSAAGSGGSLNPARLEDLKTFVSYIHVCEG